MAAAYLRPSQSGDADRDRDFQIARALLDRDGSVAMRRRSRSATMSATPYRFPAHDDELLAAITAG